MNRPLLYLLTPSGLTIRVNHVPERDARREAQRIAEETGQAVQRILPGNHLEPYAVPQRRI